MQASSTQKTKDSAGRRLGIKKFGGEEVFPGDILARQRGFKWHPGKNTFYGKDHTIHSKIEGKVSFTKDPWRYRKKIFINVDPFMIPNRKFQPPPAYQYHPELYPELAQFNPEPLSLTFKKKQQKLKEITEDLSKGKLDNSNRITIQIPDDYQVPKISQINELTQLKDLIGNFEA